MALHYRITLLLFTIIFVFILYIQSILNCNDNNSIKVFMSNILKGSDLLTKNTIHCYRIKSETLPDISEINLRKDKSLFFHETSCNSFSRGKITINARQACAVESAAILNPNLDVYLLYNSPGIIKFQGDESDTFLMALMSYENVNIMYLNYENYIKGTPVEELYNSGKLESSNFVVFHASDVIRFTSLWKYGGIYLDLDVIVTKSLEDLPLNFAGIERNDSVNSAILGLSSFGIGHSLSEKCLNELKYNFDGKIWAKNGPGLITRLLQSTCGVSLAKDMVNKNCSGFKVYPQNMFYPIPGPSWKTLFKEKYLASILNMTRNSYTLHLWNDISASQKIPITSKNAPYLYFTRKYCPKVEKAIKKYF